MMRTAAWLRLAVFLLVLCPLSAAPAAPEDLPAPIAAVLKLEGLSTRGLSIYVQEIGQPEPLLAVAADTPRHPASTMKLLTTLATLEELGPAYRWKTEAYTSAPVRNGRLDGDLYLKGYGDPYLVIEQFWLFLRSLRAQGLEEIHGDLVLDQGYFASEPGNTAEFDNQPLRTYNVLPKALMVNFQAVSFRFLPRPPANRVEIVADPMPANLDIENRVRLTQDACHGWAHDLALRVTQKQGRTRAIFSGGYAAACGDNELFRVVSEPSAYILGTFRELWSELGGRFDGGVREQTVPAGANLLYTGYSPPLSDIIRSINKYSNNVMARQLMLTLAADRDGPPGTTEKGVAVLRDWLRHHGLEFPELVLENGSGLSREEQISARHLGQVLLTGWRSPYMPELVSSLPISAMDGTLRGRFNRETELDGRMHLKTGSLRDVRSIAGYMLDRQGRRMIVVCLHNSRRAETEAGEAVQDAVLRWVYERP
ncbi:MAG TPA: D-alanyl-D-alanine carboxypeptidase/D-alanyl-D-alanine-endopeptidase [Candidatus Methylomirabilis sp.]|nr:D-alanyl-D-alanine carboxypeptidase/D-alanyl-D-alanine-endopeptidase [Candidatus Methylomirabilis sp.]